MQSQYEGGVFLIWRKNPGEDPTIMNAWESERDAFMQLDYLREHRHASVAFWLQHVSVFKTAIFDDWDPYQVDTTNIGC